MLTPKQQINADIKAARTELKNAKADLRLATRNVAAAEKELKKLLVQREKL